MHIGQRMYKTSGYAFHGTVRSIMESSRGGTRIVCEHDDGWLFIFEPSQVTLVETTSEDPHREQLVSATEDRNEATREDPARAWYEKTRYDVPPASDGRGGPHPLAGVPQAALDAATAELKSGDRVYYGECHIDEHEIEAVAHAVLMAGLNQITSVTDGAGLSGDELDQLPYIDVRGTDTLYVLPNGRIIELQNLLGLVDKLAADAARYRPASTETAVNSLRDALAGIRRAIAPVLGREAEKAPACGHCGYDRGPLDPNGWCWACNANHPGGQGADECTAPDEDPTPERCGVVTSKRDPDGAYTEGDCGTHYCIRDAGHPDTSSHRCRCGHGW